MIVRIIFLTLYLCSHSTSYGQDIGEFTDPRDGQKYKTLTIPIRNRVPGLSTKMTIMIENLNYVLPGVYVYDDDASNRQPFGLLYEWDAALVACPEGWRLPTKSDWLAFLRQFGKMDLTGSPRGENYVGEDEMHKLLMSQQGWGSNNDENGSNKSRFNGIPGGGRKIRKGGRRKIQQEVRFEGMDFQGNWWSSTYNEYDVSSKDGAWSLYLDINRVSIITSKIEESSLSCRCIKK